MTALLVSSCTNVLGCISLGTVMRKKEPPECYANWLWNGDAIWWAMAGCLLPGGAVAGCLVRCWQDEAAGAMQSYLRWLVAPTRLSNVFIQDWEADDQTGRTIADYPMMLRFFPQQRKLMGPSAQIRCGSQEQVPEEGSGEFRCVLV